MPRPAAASSTAMSPRLNRWRRTVATSATATARLQQRRRRRRKKKKKKKALTPLPKEEVERVLSWKREHLTSGNSTAEEIQAFEELNDSCAEYHYQAWMRAEFEANGGVVLVDDEFFRERDEFDRLLVEFMGDDEEDDFDFSGWNISNLRCDFYNDESEEDEEEEEGEKDVDELDAQ